MPRKGEVPKREILPDPKYKSKLVSKFVNCMMTDGKKSVIGKARVIKREKITVPSGVYDTYLVEPDLEHIGGVFKKSKNAKLQIWVTADKRRIPVKVKSKVIVGSFIAELISIERTDTDMPFK